MLRPGHAQGGSYPKNTRFEAGMHAGEGLYLYSIITIITIILIYLIIYLYYVSGFEIQGKFFKTLCIHITVSCYFHSVI